MRLSSTSFEHNDLIPDHCAFGNEDADEHMKLGQNLSPQLSWTEVPAEAKSLVLLCIDPDAPSVADDVNKEDAVISRDLPRVKFGHWGLVDLPPTDGELTEGACSNGVVMGGKQSPPGPEGTRQALNDYTGFLADNPDMAGDYFGYDGPCPPWNDELMHRYEFTLLALNIDRCKLKDRFTVEKIESAVAGHVIAEARIVGRYSLNPGVS